MDFRGDKNRVPGTEDKYVDFSIVQSDPLDFSLVISKVQINYEGTYNCRQAGLNEDNIADLKVEVPPSAVYITCHPSTNCLAHNEDVLSKVTCSCTATGAYPNTLQMRWTGAIPVTTELSTSHSSIGPNGSFDFSQDAEGSIIGTSGSIQCTLEGYVNGIEEDGRTATYNYCTTNLPPTSTDTETGQGTTTLPPTSTDTEREKDCTQRSRFALITVCCIECLVIILLIIYFVILPKVKNGSGKEEAQGLETSPHDFPEKTNAAYMDLQETKQLYSNHLDLDVPLENLNLKVLFPGNGLMNYQSAQLMLTSKREEVVVKTVSDDAPVRLAKLQANEVPKLSTLTSNVNVVQFLGRCNSVPNLLCYEFVKGSKLAEYLRENFQPNTSHQYGNTKQKCYRVPEKGPVESLPKLALQIARGMKFLTSQKFIHPGLRSEKIIINVSGQCKLYDFVSADNAKDIMTILWGKSVPYQWMPPEYLFLEKLGPSVDIWSFGVLIWEIFSYGALPYTGKDRNAVEKELRGKENLPLPNNCPGAIWQIALNCWDQSPEKRPSFEHISLQLSHMCNENKEYDEIK